MIPSKETQRQEALEKVREFGERVDRVMLFSSREMWKEIRYSYEQLHKENQIMREALEKIEQVSKPSEGKAHIKTISHEALSYKSSQESSTIT